MMEIDTTSSRTNNIMMVEVNAGSSRPNEKRPLEITSPVKEARKHPENNGSNTTVFINHGQCYTYLLPYDYIFKCTDLRKLIGRVDLVHAK